MQSWEKCFVPCFWHLGAHIYLFLPRSRYILPGGVRKAECDWRKLEEEMGKERLSLVYTQFNLLLNFIKFLLVTQM